MWAGAASGGERSRAQKGVDKTSLELESVRWVRAHKTRQKVYMGRRNKNGGGLGVGHSFNTYRASTIYQTQYQVLGIQK